MYHLSVIFYSHLVAGWNNLHHLAIILSYPYMFYRNFRNCFQKYSHGYRFNNRYRLL